MKLESSTSTPPQLPAAPDADNDMTWDELSRKLNVSVDSFQVDAKLPFWKAPHLYADYLKMADRSAVKLRREIFRMRQEGYPFRLARERIQELIATHKDTLKNFIAHNKHYQAAKEQEKAQNQDLKSRISSSFLQTMECVVYGAIPPPISYDDIPSASYQFSSPFPTQQQPILEYSYQNAQDEIDSAMDRWECRAFDLPAEQQNNYLNDLQYIEINLLGQMKLHEQHLETPAFAEYKAAEAIDAFNDTLKEKYPAK